MKYALITPARNAEDLIALTIESVVRQSVRPEKWIIVNDGSTDRTAEIAASFSSGHAWIEVLHMPPRNSYDLAGKARSFNAAFERLRSLGVDIVANVDADVSFEPDYFAFLMEKFAQYPQLGIVGTPMQELGLDAVEDGLFNVTDVFGACQVFRRECLEDIGGYLPLQRGGVDWAAVRMARMKGWQTRSFLEKRFLHHRVMGATECGVWRGILNHGRKDYYLGNHPLWQLCRVAYQMTRRPLLIRGILLLSGYLLEFCRMTERPIPVELVRFHRAEELQRLWSILHRRPQTDPN